MRASVDLPQPDSPTMPSVSPRLTVKLTPSTARSYALAVARREVLGELIDTQQHSHWTTLYACERASASATTDASDEAPAEERSCAACVAGERNDGLRGRGTQ